MELCERAANEQNPETFLFVRQELVSLLDEKGQRLSQHIPLVMCWLCGKPLPLENCKTDERGRAVHEECYTAKIARNKDTTSS